MRSVHDPRMLEWYLTSVTTTSIKLNIRRLPPDFDYIDDVWVALNIF